MKLSASIRANVELLAQEWEAFAQTQQLPAAAALSRQELRDSAAELFKAIASDMDFPESPGDQQAKSQGRHPGAPPRRRPCGHGHRFPSADTSLPIL